MNFLKRLFLFLVVAFVFSSCSEESSDGKKNIAVFIPGTTSGSPVYRMLAEGVQKACEETSLGTATISEAGVNQAEWPAKLTALAASGEFDLIISANPSLPEMCHSISSSFPGQDFIILNGLLSGVVNIATVQYNQREQSYLAGYLAGLLSASKDEKYSRGNNKIALIAAQEYPDMNNILLPGYIEGAKAANPQVECVFKVTGSWSDAGKAAEIASSLYRSGVDVILPICGGGNQGVLSSAKENGFFVVWFDDSGYDLAPGYVAGSAIMAQDKLAYEETIKYLNGEIEFGTSRIVGCKEGFIDFDDKNPLFKGSVSEETYTKFMKELNRLRNGDFSLPVNN